MNFLLAEVNDATQWILPAILLVLVIGIFVLNYFRSKKNQETMKNMVDSLKVGDRVKTYSGFYGKIIEIEETTDGKVAILETGSEKNKGILSIDINAIYAIDEKKPVVYDSEGNVIEENDKEGQNKKEDNIEKNINENVANDAEANKKSTKRKTNNKTKNSKKSKEKQNDINLTETGEGQNNLKINEEKNEDDNKEDTETNN